MVENSTATVKTLVEKAPVTKNKIPIQLNLF